MPFTYRSRIAFLERFLPDTFGAEAERLLDLPAEDLVDEYRMILEDAKLRWPDTDITEDWAVMAAYMLDHGVRVGAL